MNDRFNTIAGWVLFAGIVALGASIVTGEMFHAERPETMGYPIEGVEVEGEGGEARQADRILSRQRRSRRGRAGVQEMRRLPQRRQGRRQRARPQPVGRARRAASARSRASLISDALKGKGGTWDWEVDGRLAGQPEEIRARHQDDLRRPRQARGPRQRHRLPERAQRFAAAAARRSGARSPTMPRPSPAAGPATARKRPRTSRCSTSSRRPRRHQECRRRRRGQADRARTRPRSPSSSVVFVIALDEVPGFLGVFAPVDEVEVVG